MAQTSALALYAISSISLFWLGKFLSGHWRTSGAYRE